MAAERARVRSLLLGVAALALLAVSGCGGTAGGAAPAATPAQPLAAQAPASATVQRFTAKDFRRPIARYRRQVARGLRRAERHVDTLRAALGRGDLAGAQRAWGAANAAYGTIGAAYGAFGRLDGAVDMTPAGLPQGSRDPRFTGLHRVELALYGRRSTRDAVRPAARLSRDLRRMSRALPSLRISPLDYVRRVHEILEDTLHLQLTGVASPWSGTAYDTVAANVSGTRTVLATLRPLLARQGRVRRIRVEQDLRAIDRALAEVRRRDGTLPTRRTISGPGRRLVAARVAAATESLAYLPEALDPRPPRPVRSPYPEAP